MDRERALQYFKKLGFASTAPLHVYGHRRYLSQKEIPEPEDGLRGRSLLNADSGNTTEPDQAEPHKVTETEQAAADLEIKVAGNFKPSSQRTWTPGPISICTACTCFRTARPQPPPIPADLGSTTSHCGSESDSDDSEEEGLSLDKLLLVMARLRYRVAPVSSSTTLVRLASCFTPPDSLTEQHINQLMDFLDDTCFTVSEACLKVLEQLLELGWGWRLASRMELLDKVILLSEMNLQPKIQVLAMAVLDQLLNVAELDYQLIQDRLENEVYPSVIDCLHGKASLEVKYAACCITRTLARDAGFAARIKKESLFLLRQLRDSSGKLREVYVGVLMAIFAHPGLTEAGSVDIGILPVVKGLLRDGPCETQRQALGLLHCIMSDDRGVEVVIDDQRIVAYVMACLLMSKCRKVRTQACLVTTTLTAVHRVTMARVVLEGISHYVQPQEGVEAAVGGGGVARVTYPVPAKNQVETKLWHNADCFLDSVAGLIHDEALLDLDSDNLQSQLPVRGEISSVQLFFLSYLVQLVLNMCMWPMQRRAMGFGHAHLPKLDLTHLSDDFSLRERFSRLNHRMAVQQWKRFGPSIFAILRWVSQRVSMHLQSSSTASGHGSAGTLQRSNSSLQLSSRPSSEKRHPRDVDSPRALCQPPSTESSLQDSHAQASSRPSSAKSPSKNSSSRMPSRPSSAKSLSKNSSSRTPSRPTSAQSPSKNSSSQTPSRPTSAKSPSKNSSSQTPSRPTSAKSLSKNSSAQTASRPTSAKPATVMAREVLGEAEFSLLLSLLHFLLSMALLSCKKIPDPFSEKESTPQSESPPKRKPHPASGLWVSENPHLTPCNQQVAAFKKSEELSKKQQEDLEKEAMSDRRMVRRRMYNEGLFVILAPLLQLADPEVKMICSLILRAAVQPFDEKPPMSSTPVNKDSDFQSPSIVSFTQTSPVSSTAKSRPQSAHTLEARKTEKVINIALHRMSPSSAVTIKEALGPRSLTPSRRGPRKCLSTSRQPPSVGRGSPSTDCLILRPDSADSVATTHQSSSLLVSSARLGSPDTSLQDLASSRCWSQPLLPGQPINRECLREVIGQCGAHIIQSLFCRSRRLKLYNIMLLHDLVKLTTAESHMELSKSGIVPKLLDFIRINEDSEQLQILGLKVIKMLVLSDWRLHQLFSHHGGHALLMVLLNNSSARVQAQVRDTLGNVTKVVKQEGGGQKVTGQRPSSAPSQPGSQVYAQSIKQPRDIWEHIMNRWAEEDRVVKVLQQFVKH